MTDAQTSHYDTFQNTGRSVMVLDSIRAVCEAINNDALAATKEQPVMAGIENPCATLGTGGNQYTTIPLRPLTGDCNFILNNYIHHRIPFNIALKSEWIQSYNADGSVNVAADSSFSSDIDFAIYFLTSALMPKRFQLMIGNTVVFQNTFQRTEATVMINSLPPDVVEKSDEITTMTKLLERKTIPGAYFTWKGDTYKKDASTNHTVVDQVGEHTMTLNFVIDTFIDLQRFAPIISNLAFIPIEYGDLKLRLFYDGLENALDMTVLPSNRNGNGTNPNTSTGVSDAWSISHNNLNVIERRPLMKGFEFVEPSIQFHAASADDTRFCGGKHMRITPTAVSWGAQVSGQDATLIEIVQSTFRLREESKILLKNYIMTDNRLIIPTHTWSTALALNPSNGGANKSGQILWNFSAYNIDMLAFTFPLDANYESYLPNPVFKLFDLKLNSKSVNFIPYDGANSARFIKDTKQAFLNTDEYATNENLTYSLKPWMSIVGGNINAADGYKTAVLESYKTSSNNLDFKPNTFCYAINLTPPNSFEKGMCVASSNPQAMQLRLQFANEDINPYTLLNATTSLNYNHCFSNVYQWGDVTKVTSAPMALALQGCCLVLIYNPIVGACQAGEVVFVEPFVN